MSRRVITPGIFEDEWFGELSDREQLVWIGLFGVIADDQGRLPDNAALIRVRLWPYRDEPAKHVSDALDRFASAGRLHRYAVDGKAFLQIVKWWEHQRPQWAARSAHPAPDGWTDPDPLHLESDDAPRKLGHRRRIRSRVAASWRTSWPASWSTTWRASYAREPR